jgi:hypothetical protein
LKDVLAICTTDIAQIRDDMGYSLLHLAAYNNSDKCIEVLFNHILHGTTMNDSDNNTPKNKIFKKTDFESIQTTNKKAILKDWIN